MIGIRTKQFEYEGVVTQIREITWKEMAIITPLNGRDLYLFIAKNCCEPPIDPDEYGLGLCDALSHAVLDMSGLAEEEAKKNLPSDPISV